MKMLKWVDFKLVGFFLLVSDVNNYFNKFNEKEKKLIVWFLLLVLVYCIFCYLYIMFLFNCWLK